MFQMLKNLLPFANGRVGFCRDARLLWVFGLTARDRNLPYLRVKVVQEGHVLKEDIKYVWPLFKVVLSLRMLSCTK
jgi:hypothetical protein